MQLFVYVVFLLYRAVKSRIRSLENRQCFTFMSFFVLLKEVHRARNIRVTAATVLGKL